MVDTAMAVRTVGACAARINTGPDPLTHYVIVRSDLPVGVLAAQLVHAAGESSPGGLPAGTYAVVLAVPDEPALEKLAVRLLRAGIEFKAIREPDAPYADALMAIGVVPKLKSQLRAHFANLPLLRSPGVVQVGHQASPKTSLEMVVHGHPPGPSAPVAQR